MDNHIPLDFETLPEAEMVANARQFYSDIRRRRTVRDFLPKPIPDGILENALLAAAQPPMVQINSLGTFL